MKLVIVLFLAALPLIPQSKDSFTRFIYCREFPSGTYEKQCVDLKPDGTGESRFKPRGSQEMPAVALNLSSPGREKFVSIIAATQNLKDRDKYESKRRVANLGRKYLTLEMPSEKREAAFNYSDLKEVNTLTTFFDGLINQITIMQDIESAARYERLSVPERLDQLENEIKIGRIGDPQGLIPGLDKIIQDERILQYARQHAQQMKSQILVLK
jgi:hypothetical protein